MRRCGGCQLLHLPYPQQLAEKQKTTQRLLGGLGPVLPILGMEHPFHYRCKVQAAFAKGPRGTVVSGTYEAGTHRLVPVEHCLLEDEEADAILATVRALAGRLHVPPFDDRTGQGVLRHVLIRRSAATGQAMVVLVTGTPFFPGSRQFVRELRARHPQIATVVQNVNGRYTSMVLGGQEKVLFGSGFIEDALCGCRFRISARSFYQVNPVQSRRLYETAIEYAALTGRETVLDAYCGTGTIGLSAARGAAQVLGVELNRDAVDVYKRQGLIRSPSSALRSSLTSSVMGWLTPSLSLRRMPSVMVSPGMAESRNLSLIHICLEQSLGLGPDALNGSRGRMAVHLHLTGIIFSRGFHAGGGNHGDDLSGGCREAQGAPIALDHVQIGGRAAGAGRLVGIQLPNLVVQLARTSGDGGFGMTVRTQEGDGTARGSFDGDLSCLGIAGGGPFERMLVAQGDGREGGRFGKSAEKGEITSSSPS